MRYSAAPVGTFTVLCLWAALEVRTGGSPIARLVSAPRLWPVLALKLRGGGGGARGDGLRVAPEGGSAHAPIHASTADAAAAAGAATESECFGLAVLGLAALQQKLENERYVKY